VQARFQPVRGRSTSVQQCQRMRDALLRVCREGREAGREASRATASRAPQKTPAVSVCASSRVRWGHALCLPSVSAPQRTLSMALAAKAKSPPAPQPPEERLLHAGKSESGGVNMQA